jgi:type IV pilus assembly protein PilA
MKTISPSKKASGFGLNEVLVVIAIIGIIASMAIPSFAGLLDRGQGAKDLRNAHSLVTTFSAARSAGAKFTSLNKQAVCEALTGNANSATPVRGCGIFSTANFQVTMSAVELDRALAYLQESGSGESFTLSLKAS